MIAAKNELGFVAEAPMLAEAKDVRFVGRHKTLGDSEVNLSQSFTMMLAQLRPADQVAIVAYAGSAGERAVILDALDQRGAAQRVR